MCPLAGLGPRAQGELETEKQTCPPPQLPPVKAVSGQRLRLPRGYAGQTPRNGSAVYLPCSFPADLDGGLPTRTRTHTLTRTRTCTHTHPHPRTRTYTCTHTHTYAHTRTRSPASAAENLPNGSSDFIAHTPPRLAQKAQPPAAPAAPSGHICLLQLQRHRALCVEQVPNTPYGAWEPDSHPSEPAGCQRHSPTRPEAFRSQAETTLGGNKPAGIQRAAAEDPADSRSPWHPGTPPPPPPKAFPPSGRVQSRALHASTLPPPRPPIDGWSGATAHPPSCSNKQGSGRECPRPLSGQEEELISPPGLSAAPLPREAPVQSDASRRHSPGTPSAAALVPLATAQTKQLRGRLGARFSLQLEHRPKEAEAFSSRVCPSTMTHTEPVTAGKVPPPGAASSRGAASLTRGAEHPAQTRRPGEETRAVPGAASPPRAARTPPGSPSGHPRRAAPPAPGPRAPGRASRGPARGARPARPHHLPGGAYINAAPAAVPGRGVRAPALASPRLTSAAGRSAPHAARGSHRQAARAPLGRRGCGALAVAWRGPERGPERVSTRPPPPPPPPPPRPPQPPPQPPPSALGPRRRLRPPHRPRRRTRARLELGEGGAATQDVRAPARRAEPPALSELAGGRGRRGAAGGGARAGLPVQVHPRGPGRAEQDPGA
ncbi:basic salivary proline-rich protein 2-like [Prionailurus bengalensis]|uniref:basic salivary proline-rich protein 2-like n=1 Tax=Prionailurus bengalensis TaxID=37029 RepID=UPI001CA9627F|nr:basic salivary proline-rich protein 2-like [Prionailurus bengalensis]